MLCIDIFHVDSYHLRCIGLTAKDTGLRDYKCPYCEILKGESHYSNGGALLVGYYFILAVDYWSFFIFFGSSYIVLLFFCFMQSFEKRIELNALVDLLTDAENFCLW